MSDEKKTPSISSKTKTKEVAEEKKNKTFCYIGPTIKGKINKGVVFINTVPEPFNSFFEEHPIVKSLLVDVEELKNAYSSIKKEEGSYYVAYKKIKEGDY